MIGINLTILILFIYIYMQSPREILKKKHEKLAETRMKEYGIQLRKSLDNKSRKNYESIDNKAVKFENNFKTNKIEKSQFRKEIYNLFNEYVNNEILKKSKLFDWPLEVEYFPSKQIPKQSIELYKQIRKIKGEDFKPPNNIFINHNLVQLLENTTPNLMRIMRDQKIIPVEHILFDQKNYYPTYPKSKKKSIKTSVFDFLPRANKLSKDYGLSVEDALYIAVGEYMYQDDVIKHFWNNLEKYQLEGFSKDKAANKAFKKYMIWYKTL
jgi:hypothetical protein